MSEKIKLDLKTVVTLLVLAVTVTATYFANGMNINDSIVQVAKETSEKYTTKDETNGIKQDIKDIKTKVEDMSVEQTRQGVTLEYMKQMLEDLRQ
jgi:hypothetical protein